MKRLLDRFGSKIVALAKSIAEHGLNPTESWALVEEGGRYTVLEGNRRLVACRLLQRPDRAPGDLSKTFERISRGAGVDIAALRPSCVLFARRADARYWIQLKHHGAGNGEGTASWGPEMVYLDQLNHGGPPVGWNEFWYWLEENYRTDDRLAALIQEARNEQYTLMQRVYDWKVKDLLNAELDRGRIWVQADPSKIRPFVEQLITGMFPQKTPTSGTSGVQSTHVISSRTLNDRKSAGNVLQNLWDSTLGDCDITPEPAPNTQSRNSAPNSPPAPQPDEATQDTEPTAPPSSTNKQTGSRNRHDRPRRRDTHLYYAVKRTNMPKRVSALLKECASTEIKTHPEAASVMARVVVEFAVDALIDHRSLSLKNGTKLQDKITTVMRHLDPKLDAKTPDRPDLRGTWTAIRTDTADGHLVRDLNDCVHSYQFTAATEVAERANRLFTPLLDAVNDDLGDPATSPVATSSENRHS